MGDPTAARMDAYLATVAAQIDEHGWMLQGVFGDKAEDAFTYTVGLTGRGLPELWLGTLSPQQAGGVLNAAAQRLVDGDLRLEPGEVDLGFSVPFRLRGPCDADEAHVGVARQMHPLSVVSVWQVLWPDAAGRWPDEPEYDRELPQRLLGLAGGGRDG